MSSAPILTGSRPFSIRRYESILQKGNPSLAYPACDIPFPVDDGISTYFGPGCSAVDFAAALEEAKWTLSNLARDYRSLNEEVEFSAAFSPIIHSPFMSGWEDSYCQKQWPSFKHYPSLKFQEVNLRSKLGSDVWDSSECVQALRAYDTARRLAMAQVDTISPSTSRSTSSETSNVKGKKRMVESCDSELPAAKRSTTTRASEKQGNTKPDRTLYYEISPGVLLVFAVFEYKWVPFLDHPLNRHIDSRLYGFQQAVNHAHHEAIYQALWYVYMSYELCGNRLGVAVVNHWFSRVARMNDGTLAVEISCPSPCSPPTRALERVDSSGQPEPGHCLNIKEEPDTLRSITAEDVNALAYKHNSPIDVDHLEKYARWDCMSNSLFSRSSATDSLEPFVPEADAQPDDEALIRLLTIVYLSIYTAGTSVIPESPPASAGSSPLSSPPPEDHLTTRKSPPSPAKFPLTAWTSNLISSTNIKGTPEEMVASWIYREKHSRARNNGKKKRRYLGPTQPLDSEDDDEDSDDSDDQPGPDFDHLYQFGQTPSGTIGGQTSATQSGVEEGRRAEPGSNHQDSADDFIRDPDEPDAWQMLMHMSLLRKAGVRILPVSSKEMDSIVCSIANPTSQAETSFRTPPTKTSPELGDYDFILATPMSREDEPLV